MKKLIVGSLAGLALLSGCIPANAERTECGLLYVGSEDGEELPEGWDLASIQTVEDRVRDSFARMVNAPGFDSSSSCRSMDGVILQVRREARWPSTSSPGKMASGEFDCDTRVLTVGLHPEGPRLSALAHELAHVVQRCSPPSSIDAGRDAEHSNWTSANIIEAIIDSQSKKGK
jgi:hypothetical protein